MQNFNKLNKTNYIKMKRLTLLSTGFFALMFMLSCVPTKKYEEAIQRRDQCEKEGEKLKAKNQDLETKNHELSKTNEHLTTKFDQISKDSLDLAKEISLLKNDYNQLESKYKQEVAKNTELLSGTSSETKKILAELQKMQEELQRKEDELRALERLLNQRKENLDKLNAELLAKEAKIAELQAVLDKKESDVQALKKKLQEALFNFENNGLTISIRNGKVYVSLEESLLFASGSTQVDPKGREALKKLAQVLEQNKDINITIEGHTDIDPYLGKGEIKDNWDLSALRATNILRIILENGKIDPKRLTASGRGEFIPVDSGTTKEAKKKNRRTEIILTPKLDELFQLIDSN